jgi:hypothetical protein
MTVLKHPGSPVPSVSGQSGKYLTTNGSELSWNTLPTATNWTLLNTGDTTMGTSTSKTWTGLGGYDKYFVLCDGMSSTATIQPAFSFIFNGGTGTSAAMFRNYSLDIGMSNALQQPSSGVTGGSTLTLGYNATNSGGMDAAFFIDGCLGSGIKHFTLNSYGNTYTTYGATGRFYEGRYSLAITSLGFSVSSGNFDGGTVSIYGA